MAGNKETPRQKMINIMYLVFIAMLALNISKQVLATIGVLDEDLKKNIAQTENEIAKKTAAIENKKAQANIDAVYSSLQKMKNSSNDYFDYLGEIVDGLLAEDKEQTQFLRDVENKAQPGKKTLPDVVTMRNYQIMDKGNVLDDKFFDGNENTQMGKEYINRFKNYKDEVLSIIDSIKIKDSELEEPVFNNPEDPGAMAGLDDVVSDLEQRFDYSDYRLDTDGKEVPYLEYEFKGFPLIASMAKMTKIQNDIRYMENKLLSAILGEGELPLVSYLLPSRQQNYAGEVYDGSLVMGQKSSNFSFGDVQLQLTYPNNNKVNLTRNVDYDIEKGQIIFKKRLNLPGEYNLTGTVTKQGARTESSIVVDQTFQLFPKATTATVEPIRMNILYLGLSNPVSIVLPGATGLRQGSQTRNVNLNSNVKQSDKALGANFYAKPVDIGDAFIQVSGTVNGQIESSEPKLFRVLRAPDGTGAIVSNSTIEAGSAASQFDLLNGEISGFRPDGFAYDFNIEVVSFNVTVSGQQTVPQGGKYITGLAEDYVKAASSGTIISFTEVKAIAWEGSNKEENFDYEILPFTIIKQ